MEEWIKKQLNLGYISADDIPDIDLYMDQITTFMDDRLASGKRYPDDKIMTKTMINNYTKNHLLPPPTKKKYSKEHLYMIIMIYYLKSIMSITDIQTLLDKLSTDFFPASRSNDVSMDDIYKRTMDYLRSNHDEITDDIIGSLVDSTKIFEDFNLTKEDKSYLDYFTFISKLSYDIYMRKQIIEKLLDNYRKEIQEKNPPADTGRSKESKKKK